MKFLPVFWFHSHLSVGFNRRAPRKKKAAVPLLSKSSSELSTQKHAQTNSSLTTPSSSSLSSSTEKKKKRETARAVKLYTYKLYIIIIHFLLCKRYYISRICVLSFLSREKEAFSLSLSLCRKVKNARKKLVRFPIIASSFTSCTRRPRGRASLSLCFGADLFIRSFFRADFLRAVELTKFSSSLKFNKPTDSINNNVQRRKPESVPARGRAINHQHPRHRPTGEQL